VSDDGCTVIWWGHATVDIRMDGTRVLTDPLLRRRVGPLHSRGHRPRRGEAIDSLSSIDAVLLSHLHHDHTDLPSIRRLGSRTTTVVPVGAEALLRRHARGQVVGLAVGSPAPIRALSIRATEARHDGTRHRGHAAEAVGYLVSGSRTVYFAGDTEVFSGMADIADATPGGIDVALLPVSGWGLTLGSGHMDAAAAAQAVRLLRPRIAVPIHWGTLRIPVVWRLRGKHLQGVAEHFAALVTEAAPSTTVVVPEPGAAIGVPSRAETRP
jgi:L-ascorbate metabolism protein UlaG (beta-lactamase superfamily)